MDLVFGGDLECILYWTPTGGIAHVLDQVVNGGDGVMVVSATIVITPTQYQSKIKARF